MPLFNTELGVLKNAGNGQLVHAELILGMHGTYPAGGGNIDVYIVLREHGSRVMIVTEKVAIIIDDP